MKGKEPVHRLANPDLTGGGRRDAVRAGRLLIAHGLDVNGRIIRVEAAGRTMRDAIELMADRLRARLRLTVRPRYSL